MATLGLTKAASKPKTYLKPGATKEQVNNGCAKFIKLYQTHGDDGHPEGGPGARRLEEAGPASGGLILMDTPEPEQEGLR
ncbi:hypothetical protein [Deinococcus sp. QL22]|uniref:hypothetical protein n=1 Tax=Deinococcus sp. QL22 TaxID=2939437 RepID=UPI002017DFBF|nr:hypothetical protein [Deinococcus sp. QL22]UQN08812.1 hypothetical protein M1R55_19595 [Deinococcus sp. QL22]